MYAIAPRLLQSSVTPRVIVPFFVICSLFLVMKEMQLAGMTSGTATSEPRTVVVGCMWPTTRTTSAARLMSKTALLISRFVLASCEMGKATGHLQEMFLSFLSVQA